MLKSNIQTIERYFALVDYANDSEANFDELISLYSDDCESHSNDGSVSHGKQELIVNTRNFYNWMKGGESRHFYHVTAEEGDSIEVDWAVAARLADGSVMSLHGHNVYRFNDRHEIRYLVVTNS